MAYMYNLTSLTGRTRNVGRTVIINGFEFGRRALIVTGAAVGLAIVPTLILTAWFGMVATVLTPAAFIAAAFIFVEGRSRKGLQLRMYRSVLDKKLAKTNEIYICIDVPVQKTLGRARIVASSAPLEEEPAAPAPVFAAAKRTKTQSSVADIMKDPNS